MLKRILIMLLLVSLSATAVGIGPAHARPSQTADLANADLLPADTALYFDFRAADLNDTITFIGDTYQKVTGSKMPDVFAQLDQSLTQTLKRPASWAKDIQPWLGDHITLGVSVSDAQIASLTAGGSGTSSSVSPSDFVPQFVVIISVKDAAAADKFLKDLAASSNGSSTFNTRSDTIGSDKISIYDQTGSCGTNCASIVQAPKFFAFGLTSGVNVMIDSLKANKPKLSDQPTFSKLIGTLQPNNLMTLYMTPRIYSYFIGTTMMTAKQFNAMQPTPVGTQPAPTAPSMADTMAMLQQVFKAIDGQAIAIRRDKKVLAIDIAQSINLSALGSVYSALGFSPDLVQTLMPKPLAGKLAKQIPEKALAVVMANGLSNLYQGLKLGLKSGAKFSAGMQQVPGVPNYNEISANIDKFEGYLKLVFDLDMQNDILSWMGGEFALYMVFDQNSSLSKLGSSPWPFDHTLLVDTTDTGKTTAFLTKLNAGLTKNAKINPVSAGDNLYTITVPQGPDLAYGLIGNTFFLTTGSGLNTAKAAINGDGVIANSPAWQAAQANAVEPQAQFWYVDLSQIAAIVKVAVPADQLSKPDTKAALALLDLFQSAMISTSTIGSNGMSTLTLQLIMR